ncbi:MAG: phage terminase small subunit-related protein [Cetobacterium sp.]|uniref:phage terminase small subunit-related protein n=1 Tax=Cetobacterium sp. TaxID=2071632 RepID=UPI003F2D2A38
MARSRELTKENAKKLYEEGFGSLSQIAKELNLSLNTLKSWRTRDKKEGKEWVQPPRKIKLKEAKSIVVNGGTIKEASEKTGIKESTLMNHSVRENWMSKQKDYLERLYGSQEHIQRRLESIDFLNWIKKKSMNLGTSLSPIALDESLKGYQRLANIVKTTITAQAELLGISGVEELQIKLLEADLKRERNQIEREKYNGGYVSKVSLEEEDLIKEVGKGYRKFIKSKSYITI